MFEIFAPTNIKIPFGLSNFFLRRAGAGGAILFRSAASSGVRSGGLCRVPADGGTGGVMRPEPGHVGEGCRGRSPGFGGRRAAGQAVSCGRSQGTSTEAVAAVAGQAGGNGQPDGGRRVRPATSARERRYPAATCPDGSHAQPAAPDEGAWHASQHPPRGGSNGRGSSR